MKAGFVIAAASTLTLGSFASAQTATTTSTKLLAAPIALNTSLQGSTATENTMPDYFTLRAGLAFPIDSSLSHASTIFVGAGVDFTFSNQFFKNAETYISVDWLGRTHGNARFNIFPLALNERFYFQPGATGKYGAPAGAAYAFIGLGGTIYDFSNSTFRFSGRVGLGTQFTQNWLAEATLYVAEPVNGVHADAIAAYIGYKF